MIIAGIRPPGYATLRAELARRAQDEETGEAAQETTPAPQASEEPATSAVDVAPRPPSD